MLDPWICQCVCLQSYDCLTVKAVKASINVSNVSYKSCSLNWYAKKEKYLHEIYMFTFTKHFPPGLPNLGAQIRCAQNPNRCAQNRYTAVQTDQKYPLYEQ